MSKFAQPTAAAKKTVTKAKPVITPTTKIEVEQPAPAATDDEVHTAWQQVNDALNNLWAKFERPSWLRELANITCGLIAYASEGSARCMVRWPPFSFGRVTYWSRSRLVTTSTF